MKRRITAKGQYTTYANYPLVAGDVRSYELYLDLGEDVPGAEFKVTAIRADGKAIEDIGTVQNGIATYTMASNMYSVPGDLVVRLAVLHDMSVLTDREIVFKVLEGTSGTNNAETVVPINDSVILRLGNLEQILSNKVDKAEGKGLSANDFTDKYKQKLDTLDETIGGEVERVSEEVDNLSDSFDEHKENKSNPHGVTPEQVGTYTKVDVDLMIGTKADKLTTAELQKQIYNKADISTTYTKMEVDTKLDKKANKEDVVSAYRFCGSVDTFDDLPYIYKLIPCNVPIIHSENPEIDGTVWGSFDKDTHTVTVREGTLETDTITIPIVPITINGLCYSVDEPCGHMSAPLDTYGCGGHGNIDSFEMTEITEVTLGFHPANQYSFGGSASEFVVYKITPNDVDEYGMNLWTCDLQNGSIYEVKETGLSYGWTGSTWDVLGTSHIDQEARQGIENLEADIGDVETALDSIINIQNSLIGGDGV